MSDRSGLKMNARQARSLEFRGAPVPKFLQALHAQVNGNKGGKQGHGDGPRKRDELEDLLGIGSAEDGERIGGAEGEGEGRENLDDLSGDEWDGAQIVVLKDGKHMSADEVQQAKEAKEAEQAAQLTSAEKLAAKAAAPSTQPSSFSSQAGLSSTLKSKRRAPIDTSTSTSLTASSEERAKVTGINEARESVQGTKGGMEDAKELILAEKRRRAEAATAAEDAEREKEEEQRAKKRKAKEHRKEEKNKAARREKKKSGKGLSFDMDD